MFMFVREFSFRYVPVCQSRSGCAIRTIRTSSRRRRDLPHQHPAPATSRRVHPHPTGHRLFLQDMGGSDRPCC
ncbi:hypothetical protein SEVIR_4G277950v4 [Setaria viridis]